MTTTGILGEPKDFCLVSWHDEFGLLKKFEKVCLHKGTPFVLIGVKVVAL